jgi:hypothetical protein
MRRRGQALRPGEAGADPVIRCWILSGDTPVIFEGIRDKAMQKQRAYEQRRQPGGWGVDYVFDVPIDVAAMVADYRHNRAVEAGLFADWRALRPINGNVLTRLADTPKWWQTVGSIEYK